MPRQPRIGRSLWGFVASWAAPTNDPLDGRERVWWGGKARAQPVRAAEWLRCRQRQGAANLLLSFPKDLGLTLSKQRAEELGWGARLFPRVVAPEITNAV